MNKHTYTNKNHPTNTGSLSRPARFNLRLTCSARARFHRALNGLKKVYEMPDDACIADVWEKHGILILEHFLRTIKNGETAIRDFTKAQGKPLPKCDYKRAKKSTKTEVR